MNMSDKNVVNLIKYKEKKKEKSDREKAIIRIKERIKKLTW